MASIHLWRWPNKGSEEEIHNGIESMMRAICHSSRMDDITPHEVAIHVQVLPKKTDKDYWRRARVSVPYLKMAQRIVEDYGQKGQHKLPHGTLVQMDTNPPVEALYERLRTSVYVPPSAQKDAGSSAILLKRIGYGRLMTLGEKEVTWSLEWQRSHLTPTYALFDDVEQRIRLESAHKPAICIDLQNVQAAFKGEEPGELVRVLLILRRPAPLIIGALSNATPEPGELFLGRKGPQGALSSRCSALSGEHDEIAPYISTELLIEIELNHWRAFEASSQAMGIPKPFIRAITVERAGLYRLHLMGEMDAALGNSASVGCAFQLDALARNGVLRPDEVTEVAKDVNRALRKLRPENELIRALQETRWKLTPRFETVGDDTIVLKTTDWRQIWKKELRSGNKLKILHQEANTMTSKVYVTPTRCFLDGPFPGISDRVIRAYDHNHHFIRVALVDEDLMPFKNAHTVDNNEFFNERFAPILLQGITICGRHFDFLAYSMSSMREHTAWFVARFRHKAKDVTADTIRKDIGTLTHLRFKPARYAARLSQALTGTECSVPLLQGIVSHEPDIFPPNSEEAFTDGCGRMSPAMANTIHQRLPFLHAFRPEDQSPLSSVQMRLGGAKGMLAVDTTLKGEQIILRDSMCKFEAGEYYVEICRSFRTPSQCYLNRPLVQVLEALGIDKKVFLDIQTEYVKELEIPHLSAHAASDFCHGNDFGVDFGLHLIFSHVHHTLDMPMAHFRDPFLKRCLDIALHVSKRLIKYKARIRIKASWTLVGVADAHGLLEEGEIYACITDTDSYQHPVRRYLEGRVAVSRSPVVHPGDVQIVKAIGRVRNAQLAECYDRLTNVVVFSTRGSRPLPAQLAGGDLDGDVFQLIQDERLIPAKAAEPSPPSTGLSWQAMTTRHPSTGQDIARFFLEYMQNENLGLIERTRLAYADAREKSVFDPDCLRMARLSSIAVDYRKSGIAVPSHEIPLSLPKNPDFMAKEGGIENKGATYTSWRALGIMYRGVEVPRAPREDDEEIEYDCLHDAIEEAAEKSDIIPAESMAKSSERLLHDYASTLRRLCMSQTPALTEQEAFIGCALAPSLGDTRDRNTLARETASGVEALVKWTKDQVTGISNARRGVPGAEAEFFEDDTSSDSDDVESLPTAASVVDSSDTQSAQSEAIAAVVANVTREEYEARVYLSILRYARSQGKRWGARSLLWICALPVLKRVKEKNLAARARVRANL